MAQSRRKQLEKLEITEAPKDETNRLSFRFEYDVEPWNELVIMKNLTIRIGDRVLLEPFTHHRLPRPAAGHRRAQRGGQVHPDAGAGRRRRPSGGMVRLGTGARPQHL